MIKILVAGDFCPSHRIDLLIKERQYDFIWKDFTHLLKSMDYNVINQECPIVRNDFYPAISKTGPALKTSESVIKALKNGGFNLLTLANNHFYDYGEQGVIDTLQVCQLANIDYVGGGRSLKDAQKVFYKQIENFKIAFINVCENEFSIATDEHGGSNPLDLISNYYQIQEAKKKSDFLVMIVHGGHEGYPLPSLRMQQTYRFFVDAGASVVIGHHPHCFSGYEIYKDVPIFYSLGNFCFDSISDRTTLWNQGFVVCLSLSDKLRFEIVPYIQCGVEPGIRFLTENEKVRFYKELDRLNNMIQSPSILKDSFQNFVSKQQKYILSLFDIYTNRYLRALYTKGLLPSFVYKKRKVELLNRIRCEAHRDILIEILKS